MPPKASIIHINLRLIVSLLHLDRYMYSARLPLAPNYALKILECFNAEVHVSVSRDRGPARRAAADRERLL